MLINKDHLLHQLDGRPEDGWMSIKAVRSMIEDAPSIDAVEVIRCKDCKKRLECFIGLFCGMDGAEDGYCSCAERKEE